MKKACMNCGEYHDQATSSFCTVSCEKEMFSLSTVSPTVDKTKFAECNCLVCSKCGAKEVEDCSLPQNEWKWQIRAFKVDNYSHCMKCNNWF